MGYNPDCQIAGGMYFRDPVTMQDLTVGTPRTLSPAIDDTGPFRWPTVKSSDGRDIKIVFRLFTDYEKACYKAYRQRGKAKAVEKPAHIKEEAVKGTHPQVETCVRVSGESVPSAVTLAYVRNCDMYLGVWIFEDQVYDLLTVKGSRGYMPVHRSLIPEEDRERLGIGG